jgi:hypothetical protein
MSEYRGYPKRRICWPNPDATCLHGGCGYCNDNPFRSVKSIRDYARTAGTVYHRGGQQVDAWRAFCEGVAGRFYNAETKGVWL